MSACLPIVLGMFTLIYTIQQNQIARDNRLQDEKKSNEMRQQNIYDKYLEDITTFKIDTNINLQTIRIKTLNALSQLDIERKKMIISFLYDIGLIHSSTPKEARLNLSGADLMDVKFIRSSTFHCHFDKIDLSAVLASNVIFSQCRIWEAKFDRAFLMNAKFINCSMAYSTFIAADLSQAKFLGDANNAGRIDLSNSKLIQAYMSLPMRNANLTNTDLFQSHIMFNNNSNRLNQFVNTRLSDGTFTMIDTSQLVKEGSAEYEGYWFTRAGFSPIEQSNRSEEIGMEQIVKAIDGKYYFKLFSNSRAFQDIDVQYFSLFIDSEMAWFNLSAYLACPFSRNRTDMTDIYLRFTDENVVGIKSEIIESNRNQVKFHYKNLMGRIPSNTRQMTLFLGVHIDTSLLYINDTIYSKPYCVIDYLRLNIFKNT